MITMWKGAVLALGMAVVGNASKVGFVGDGCSLFQACGFERLDQSTNGVLAAINDKRLGGSVGNHKVQPMRDYSYSKALNYIDEGMRMIKEGGMVSINDQARGLIVRGATYFGRESGCSAVRNRILQFYSIDEYWAVEKFYQDNGIFESILSTDLESGDE